MLRLLNLYNVKGNLKVTQFSWMFGPNRLPVFLLLSAASAPTYCFSLRFWWSAEFAADVSPTQWKCSLMCLYSSRLSSYGKKKNWREIMNFWIGLISFRAFQKC